MTWLLQFLSGLFRKPIAEKPAAPWLIDKDGRIYKPERRVVLRATTTEGETR